MNNNHIHCPNCDSEFVVATFTWDHLRPTEKEL